MIARKNSWIKRMIAAWMAAGMVISTTLPSLAEGMTVEYGSQEIADGALTGADLSAEDAQTGDQENTGDSGEENIPEAQPQPDGTDTASPEDQTERNDSAETEQQTEGAEDAPQEVQLSLRLLAAGEDLDNQTPSLSLIEAAGMSDKLNVDASTKTIEVHDGEGLILLSHVSPVEYYKEYTIKLITTTGWDVAQSVTINGTSYSFLGLGDESHPYEGALMLDVATAATQYSISTTKALFNALSTKASLDKLPFSISKNAPETDKPLLAEKIMKAEGDSDSSLSCSIVLRNLNAESILEAQIGGVVDTIEKGASANISFENQFTRPLKVSGKNHIGLFCNTLESDASLTAEFTNASGAVSVEATGATGDAGGFVGHMDADASLIIGGASVAEVTSHAGNAGGLVGSATDGSIQLKTGENGEVAFTFADSLKLSAASDKAAGGLIGECTITKTKDGTSASNYDLSEINFKNITISSGQNAGGLFGVLKNTSEMGAAVSVTGNNSTNPINTEVSAAVINFGGLIGSYTADKMASSLSIKGATNNAINVTSTGGTNVNTSYGGVIGEILSNSYVEIENVSATTADMKNDKNASFGGLVGKMKDGLLNVGNVTLATANLSNDDKYDISKDADESDGHGGLVGHLVKGVLRLHGSTDLSGQKITTAYHHVGQIVGYNENGLVYALGSGSDATEQGIGWSLTRYSGSDRSGSDIGNWGEVVRLGGSLTEGKGGVFTFDENAHTVKVNNGDGSGINNANAFAAYALAFDISGKYTTAENTVLKFQSTVNAANRQNVSLTNDIDLTGTGIIGIGKDDNSGQKFTGTFVGNDHTVTLDIGTTYGVGISDSDGSINAAGQLYTKRSNNRDAHYSLALIPVIGEATIQNIKIAGKVSGKVPKTVNQVEDENDIRYPVFVSAVVGLADAAATFDGVTVNAAVSVSEETSARKLHVWQSGFLGRYEGSSLTFKNCTWGSDASLSDERTTTDHHRIGGLAAEVMGGCKVTVGNCTLNGKITSKATSNAYVGGLIAVSRGETSPRNDNTFTSNPSEIHISGLLVNGEKIETAATATSGGLLGYRWQDTNVTFVSEEDTAGKYGVTVSDSSLNANQAQFGGLVYLATGYWKATAKNSIVFSKNSNANVFAGKSAQDNPSGLLVGTGVISKWIKKDDKTIDVVPSALYLEVGTYGKAKDAAYVIAENSVTLKINNSEYFDELVGFTKYDDIRDMNAVISIAVRNDSGQAIPFDQNGNNTYTYQTGKHYKNSKARYYYNLDAYRSTGVNFENVTNAESLMLWSVSQYAADTLKKYFWQKAADAAANDAKNGTETAVGVCISGQIDLTGYSYYPVTPIGSVALDHAGITFGHESIEAIEETNENKKPSDADYQHYLMQHGLLYNTGYSVSANDVSFAGTVGKAKENGAVYNSGALIFGTAAGDPTKTPIELTLNNITLAGIRVTGMEKNVGIDYAPLLINKIEKSVKLTVDTLFTGEGYTATDGSDTTTRYAATSLIGNVGNQNATKLTLSFSNIGLDGRLEQSSSLPQSVWNNGTTEVNYHTNHTIFARATLLEKFQYVPAEGSGAYNFNSTDTQVTYGVELTNTGTTGRNPDKQYQYYDGGYISDEKNAEKTEEYVKSRYGQDKFIRYVYNQEKSTENIFELDINQKAIGLLQGCGTYGDPYIITDGDQLISLAAYFQSPETVNAFKVVFNSKVFADQKQTVDGYHTENGAINEATGSDITYTWEKGSWQTEDGEAKDAVLSTDTATKYLLNAYYQIKSDIEIKSTEFAGLGTLDKPFSGVISGQNQNKVKLACTGSRLGFGGLIAYSRGSVVKDLVLDYSASELIMNNDEFPGINNNYPFFGGVVGYCMGGDTIIDHVSVKFTGANISFSGKTSYLIPAGGYVGLVGGAKEADYYEKKGGGVVFRNMGSTEHDFSTVCTDAGLVNQTVQKDGKSTTGGGRYFFRNPYVGRVLDGYVCSETDPLDNTDKNYTIPTVTPETNDLAVEQSNGTYNITVASAQGLWLLSAIVNSGAGAMDADGQYSDVGGETIDAYQLGKPRTASYEGIGDAAGADLASKLLDEAYWGGNISAVDSAEAKKRVSYLVRNYTAGTDAASIAGKSSSANTNNPVALTFSGENIDMTSYGNGFRGIGSSYGHNIGGWQNNCSIPKVYRRNLLIQSVNAQKPTDTTITLNMNQNDYYAEYEKDGSWRNQGAGLFIDFHFTNGCMVRHLKVSGTVKAGTFDTDGKLTFLTKSVYTNENNKKIETEVGVGGFAARTANSWEKVTFANFSLENLEVYGGTSAGGCIGFADYPDNNNVNKEMIAFGFKDTDGAYQPWAISNVTVRQWVNSNGSAGGLIGWFESQRKLTVLGYGENDSNNITDLKITTIANTSTNSYCSIGGLVGSLDHGSMEIQGINAKEVNISGQNLRDLGGLIGGKRQVGTVAIRNCVLDTITVESSTGENNQGGIGGVIGAHEQELTMSNVRIKGNSKISGFNFVGGFTGKSAAKITIQNCAEENVKVYASRQHAGGFIGRRDHNSEVTIKNCTESNGNILGKAEAGGLIGNVNNSNDMKISYVAISDVWAVTQNKGNCAGMLVGYAGNKNIYGYNILTQNSQAGYYGGNINVENLKTVTIQPSAANGAVVTTNGLWIGEGESAGTIKLVAVAAKGNVYPQNDVGTKSTATVSIVYADKPADTSYHTALKEDKPYLSANPWLDVNPKSDVPFEDGTVMTGNGVGMTDGTTVAETILESVKNGTDADRYWNLKDSDGQNKAIFSQFLDADNDAYLTTYRAEEAATTTVKPDIDFPVLVVNNAAAAEVDTLIWNYIAAMTNVESGTVAKAQVENISAATYQWKSSGDAGSFEKQDTASLNVSAKKISIVPNAYDNQSSQFTLLDITYADPTGTNETGFHLYIPVLVKKVLYVYFKTRFLTGTDYCAADYPMDDASTNHYATAGFDESVTAYMEYTYDEDTDWQSLLDNGESLLWSYGKILDLANGSTAETGKNLLPKGTKLTLVDRQTKQYYTYTITGEEDLHRFNLSALKTPDGSASFNPVNICDLLDLEVSGPIQDGDIQEGTTYYVVESDQKNATVQVGNVYYRKAQDTDRGEKYRITVAEASEARSESYYLTIQIPMTEGYDVINNRLNYAVFSREKGTLPATIRSDAAQSGSSYVIYNGVGQTFTISTNRIHNGSTMDDTVMENGDSIKIRLESKLQLTQAGKEGGRFRLLGPSEFYHQFDISLKKYLENSNGEYDILGTENITYQYTVKGNGLDKAFNGTIQNMAGAETLTIPYGNEELKKALDTAVDDNSAVTITAEITLMYAQVDRFPTRSISDSDSGISAIATSRIANTSSQLSIVSGDNKKTTEHNNRYYTENPSKATLTYSAVDGTGIGDTTQQLGINPSDEVNVSGAIDTRADYDYSGVDAEVLEKAKSIRYTMQLFQKSEDGTYKETDPLVISNYLQNISQNVTREASSGTSYEWTESFAADDMKHQFTRIQFTPLTGDAFEKSGYMYANYRVRLTAVLLGDSGKEINGTKATDYIIYTNARIYQEILDELQNTTTGEE